MTPYWHTDVIKHIKCQLQLRAFFTDYNLYSRVSKCTLREVPTRPLECLHQPAPLLAPCLPFPWLPLTFHSGLDARAASSDGLQDHTKIT